jgi:hypothetical protein
MATGKRVQVNIVGPAVAMAAGIPVPMPPRALRPMNRSVWSDERVREALDLMGATAKTRATFYVSDGVVQDAFLHRWEQHRTHVEQREGDAGLDRVRKAEEKRERKRAKRRRTDGR